MTTPFRRGFRSAPPWNEGAAPNPYSAPKANRRRRYRRSADRARGCLENQPLPGLNFQTPSIASYASAEDGEDPSVATRIQRVEPTRVEVTEFHETIRALSPTFIQVFGEASEAKARGLLQVAGPGFRKAFEFLIKDYAISKAADPKEIEGIKQSFSGDVVKKQVGDAGEGTNPSPTQRF